MASTTSSTVVCAVLLCALTALGLLCPTPAAAAVALDPAAQKVVGRVRVQALSATLVRIEPEGPRGFEDNTTFVVVSRDFAGVPLTTTGTTTGTGAANTTTTLSTKFYTVTITQPAAPAPPPGPAPMCAATTGHDIASGNRISTCRDMAKPCLVGTQAQCCGNCSAIKECTAWVFAPSSGDCWLMASASGTKPSADRNVGGSVGPSPLVGISATVKSPSGAVLWSTDDLGSVGQDLEWPSPTQAPAYAIKDFPRFYAPPWGPTPIPASAHVDPALTATNGYDFRNNQNGDTYVFLLGSDLDGWHHGRREFVQLAGPTPLLPDFAYGTWFTYWHQYTEAEALGEIERWDNDSLPIDVWALDMNWRNSPHGHQSSPPYREGENHFYTYPNTELFPDFAAPGTAWFDKLKSKGLRTYFNDHPFPTTNGTALQTSPEEVAFRWAGLSLWMGRGLTYWWFDANWGFSIPPPNVHYGGSGDGADWDGMSNRVWGSHVYYTSVEVYNKNNPNREHTLPPQRPMALTKYADANMHPGLVQHQHPAQHRYPVWWTGDGVSLEASVESMVDSGVYDFKPFVHSDCGGDYRPKQGGDLLRWTEHCTFGSIFRYHGSEHQPWSYDQHVEDVIRTYLNMRYKLIPSLISAGKQATESAFPLVVRCDLFWPEHAPDSASNHQYLHLNDTLVAPIWDSTDNVTTRTVWIPPGDWVDAWSGATVTGPKNVSSSQPYERVPLWHRKGGMTVITSAPGLRVDRQDWSELTVEAYPDLRATGAATTKTFWDRTEASPRTLFTMAADAEGRLTVEVGAAEDAAPRTWILRLHLDAGRRASRVTLDGGAALVEGADYRHIEPEPQSLPFGGKGAPPPPGEGPVLEVAVRVSASSRTLVAQL